MIVVNTFGAIVRFLFEKRNKTYEKYGVVSITKEKRARAQKTQHARQLCWGAGRLVY